MRTSRAVTITLSFVLVVATGCGSSTKPAATGTKPAVTGTTSAVTGTTPATKAAPVLTALQLKAALLTDGELPEYWEVNESADEGEQATTTTEPTATGAPTGSSVVDHSVFCPKGVGPLRTEQHEVAASSFFNPEVEAGAVQGLTSAPDAAEHFADIKRAADSCVGQKWTADMEGEAATLTVTRHPGPKVGDEVVEYRIHPSIPSLTERTSGPTIPAEWWAHLASTVVVVRRGSVIEVYTALVLQPGQALPPMWAASAADFYAMVQAGDQKVGQHLAALAG